MNYSVGVVFQDKAAGYRGIPKVYYYLTETLLEVGTWVIVDSPYSGYTCVQVGEAHKTVMKADKWIVDVVDDSAYRARQERIKRFHVLKAQLEKEANRVLEAKKYEFLAADPEMAKLLEEFKSLQP